MRPGNAMFDAIAGRRRGLIRYRGGGRMVECLLVLDRSRNPKLHLNQDIGCCINTPTRGYLSRELGQKTLAGACRPCVSTSPYLSGFCVPKIERYYCSMIPRSTGMAIVRKEEAWIRKTKSC
jgi:hypothetical protein